MKICVIGGGGAIGGYLAVMLARAGNEVTVVARGATLAAIQERGLALIMDDQPEPLIAQVNAVEKITDVENPDLVIWLSRLIKLSLSLMTWQKLWAPILF